MKKIALTLSLCMLSIQTYAAEGGSNASQASMDLSAQGLSQVVNGSADIFAAGSEFTVTSVKTVGDSIFLSLKSAKDSATVTIKLSLQVAGHVSVAVGQLITATVTSTGYLLQAGGKAIAFIPNKLGQGLIASNKLS